MKLSENNYSRYINDDVFKTVSDVSELLNQEVYVVGGFVRDILISRPSNDLDFVTLGSGITFAKKTAELLKVESVSIFKNFGTAMLKTKNYELQFVGARKESYSRNSRNPIVEDGSLEDDQLRRDFTINALAISLNKTTYGKLIDPFNGVEDLQNKIIKTPTNPDITFSDDPLRMLRAIRFSAQLNYDIHSDTLKAIKDNAYRIEIVSQERITDELNKIILSDKPSLGFELLDKTGILEFIFPEFIKLKGREVINGISHKDNFHHTLEVLDNILPHSKGNLMLRWTALLHDIAKPATKRFSNKSGWTFHGHEDKGARMVPKIFKKLKLPLDSQMLKVQKLVKLHLRPIALTNEQITDSALRRLLFDAGDDLEDLLTLCRADITSKNQKKVIRYLKRFDVVEQKLEELEKRDNIRNWQPPISGEEIMKVFNLKPSKEVGLIKQAIRNAILDGEIDNNYKSAYKFMLSKAEIIINDKK